MLLQLLLTGSAIGPSVQQPVHPVHLDRTGIEWQVPFEAARTKARELGRLLAIKPVAFGTTPEGCW